jgi:flagellar hook-length control protein FliK
LIHEISRVQANLEHGALTQSSNQPHGQRAQPPIDTTVWALSETGNKLSQIFGRHPEGGPSLSISIQAETPATIARALRDAISSSEVSHHNNLAKAVLNNTLQASTAMPLPPGINGQQFDSAAMLLMTGQIKTQVETPNGSAVLIWHREDAKPSQGVEAHISAVSIGMEHPELGPIITHISLTQTALDIKMHCSHQAKYELEQNITQLRHQLREIQQTANIKVEAGP